MESIYNVTVSKFLHKYRITRFNLPNFLISKNLFTTLDNTFIAKFNDKTFEYKIGSIISKSEYQMILHLLELELSALGEYPVIYVKLEYDNRANAHIVHTINAPTLDPSKHIVCHMRPIIYKHDGLYYFKLINNFNISLKCGQRLMSICMPSIETSVERAREIYYKYGDMTIDEYIEKVDMVSHISRTTFEF